jgi:hypothetical protein
LAHNSGRAKTKNVGELISMRLLRVMLCACVLVCVGLSARAHAQDPLLQKAGTVSPSNEPGLLFYLSGDHGFNADYAAGGVPQPNYVADLKILPGGAKGGYIQCGDNQLLSYWAPGNIYAQRGTLDFDWRPREAVDETEFPVFRVGYADHSSWDMVWLRIDYNGHGFDAFVTDQSLGRTRVSYTMKPFPAPGQWIHLTLAWDETRGIRFYVDGKFVAEAKATGRFDAALDQFGPHSRIISPQGVESTYSYDRGGDLDELRIYDRMLSDDDIAQLARHEIPTNIPPIARPMEVAAASPGADSSLPAQSWEQEWWYRYGWNLGAPPTLPAERTVVRKVEIHDAFDLKRWWWKGTDGIRETTWPSVYNRSRLPGRWDYFQLPDWDCYVDSGKSVTFWMPDEAWNHIEIEGRAWGKVDLMTPGNGDPKAVADPDQEDTEPLLAKNLFERPKGQERTSNQIAEPVTGEKIRFTNVEQEWPIGEFQAYYVHPGAEPAGVTKLSYTLSARGGLDNPAIEPLKAFIAGRFAADERATVVGAPGGGGGFGGGARAGGGAGRGGRNRAATQTEAVAAKPAMMPIVHVLIPSDFRAEQGGGRGAAYTWENMHAGLDGIAIDLPALNLKPTHGGLIPMNIQVMDPIWPMRTMLDFNFSVKPGERHTLWLDTRDRILQPDKSLYLTIASASPEFGADALEGVQVRLIFKDYEKAVPEHVSDRLTQVRDNYANMTEESVNSRKLNLFNRFDADISDLLRVDPTNQLALDYWHEKNPGQPAPPFKLPTAPPGVPEWAFLQVTDLGMLSDQLNWWIDNRQISYGDFGGGIGDDSDYLNWWPGAAMMGIDPDKLKRSQERTLDASFTNDMWDKGLAKGQYDELHAYEDGLNMLGEAEQIDFGSPKELERAMITAKRLEWLTGINSAGQRQIKSNYYSGSKMATGGVWGWAKNRSYFVYHPALQLVLFNGTAETRKLVLETADGFLAHYHADGNGRPSMHLTVNFKTNEDLPTSNDAWFVLWAAYRWTGDKKYLAPFDGAPAQSLRQINSDALDILNVRDTWGKNLMASTVGPAIQNDAGNSSETENFLRWQVTGDTSYLNKVYAAQIETATDRYFINRQGSLWIDRIYFNSGELQRSRLGGVALLRGFDYPGNVVSWRFQAPANERSVAILVPKGMPDHIKIVAYNMEDSPVTAQMTGWEVDPGKWEITQGTAESATAPMQNGQTRTENFERSSSVPVTFPPHATTVIEMKLKERGVPYWSRPDLGIGHDDVKVEGNRMRVTVHSLGAVDSPEAKVVLRDANGKVLATAKAAAMKPPTDLIPKTELVTLAIPAGADAKGGSITIEARGKVPEITQLNNRVQF